MVLTVLMNLTLMDQSAWVDIKIYSNYDELDLPEVCLAASRCKLTAELIYLTTNLLDYLFTLLHHCNAVSHWNKWTVSGELRAVSEQHWCWVGIWLCYWPIWLSFTPECPYSSGNVSGRAVTIYRRISILTIIWYQYYLLQYWYIAILIEFFRRY